MDNARASLMVGLVAILGVGSFLAMYSVTRPGFQADDNSFEVYALFDDVSGLGPGTRVTVAGVQVGEVSEIVINTDDRVCNETGDQCVDLARVQVVLKNNLELYEGRYQENGVWKDGATLTRKQASLLGDQYLALTRGIHGRRLLDGDEVRNVVTQSGLAAIMKELARSGSVIDRMEQIFEKLDTIATDVQEVTGAVRNILGGPEGEQRMALIAENLQESTAGITEIVTEVRTFTGDVRGFLGSSVLGRGEQVGRIVNNVEQFTSNAAELSSTASTYSAQILDDVRVVTSDVRSLIRGSRDDVETSLGTIKGALASFTNTMQRLDGVINHIQSITGKIDEGEGTLGQLVNDDSVLSEVREVVTDAGDLVRRVTGLQTRVELQSEFYFRQRALKNILRLRLQPKEDKYYLLELIDDPRGRTVVESEVTQTNDPSLPPVVHESSSTTTSGIKFSFQFAKKWYFLTGRFGVFEGTGGLGMDMEFLDDDLRISADLFDFSQDEYPRMRALMNYEFLKHFYVSAGVDDVFNSSGFDWFVGGGIRFTDDDFKALMTIAPAPSL